MLERHAFAVDLGVHRHEHTRVAKRADSAERAGEGARHSALRVMRRFQPVERNAHAVETSLGHLPGDLGVDAATAGGHPHFDAVPFQRAQHGKEAWMQVRFPANQRHLEHLEPRERLDQRQAFSFAELVSAWLAGARATVLAAQVAAQRQLPHGDARAKAPIHRA